VVQVRDEKTLSGVGRDGDTQMPKIGGVISGALAARAVSRHISDRFISKRINDALDEAEATIAAWYAI